MVARAKRLDLRSKFIDAAWKLFASAGYDGATIDRLISRLRVSKGAFYHYFSSKEDVLNAVVERMIAQGMSEVQPLLECTESSAIDKLNAFLDASREWRHANIDAVLAVAEVLMRDENIIILHKLYQRIVSLMHPALSRIVVQGTREGVFEVDDADETALFLLHMMNVITEMQTRSLLETKKTPEDFAILWQRANLYLGLIERILGAPRGSIRRLKAGVFGTVARSIRARGKEAAHGTHPGG